MTVTALDRQATDLTLLDSATIRHTGWQELGDGNGVAFKRLWADDRSVAGILRLRAGVSVNMRLHPGAQLHLWVLDGPAVMIDVPAPDSGSTAQPTARVMPTGSYAHIPAGVVHAMTSPAHQGTCQLLFIYQRRPSATLEDHHPGAERRPAGQ